MYCLRIGGTNEYISAIDPTDSRCYPPGSATSVEGWNHPQALKFENRPDAEDASVEVERIEGYTCSVESI